MRVLLVVSFLSFLLLAGCAGPSSSKVSSSTDPSGHHGPIAPCANGCGENRTRVTLTTFTGAPAGNIAIQVGNIGFDVPVPAGGAEKVHWTLQTTGLTSAAVSTVEGPGCTAPNLLNAVAQTGTSEISGFCADLPEGTHQFSLATPAPAAGFTVTVYGDILA